MLAYAQNTTDAAWEGKQLHAPLGVNAALNNKSNDENKNPNGNGNGNVDQDMDMEKDKEKIRRHGSCLPTHNDNPLQILAGVGGYTVSHEPAKSAWGSATKHA